MWQKIKNTILLFFKNLPAVLTIIFAMFVLWESHDESYQATALLRWLIFIVGLLATSELIERLGVLRRIEKFSRETWNVNVPKISVYPSRIDAKHDIEKILRDEKKEISIIAGSLGGTIRLVPDLFSILSDANKKNVQIRMLISHPDYMAQRAKFEGRSEKKQLQRTLEKLFGILEDPQISLDKIRLYLFVPTCWAIIAHGQRKLFLNPYTIGKGRAEDTLSIMLDGSIYPEAYDKFITAHLEEPWSSDNYSIPFEQFIKEHNSEIAKIIGVVLLEKSSSKPQGTPLIVAINGCTAMGKSRLADEIAANLNHHDENSCIILETDGWIKIDREKRRENKITGFDPESYDIDALSIAVKQLSSGREVLTRTYNHAIGKPEDGGSLRPGKIIIIDGLMSTHQNFRNLIDICYWIDCAPDSHKERRISRDIEYRNYSHDDALQNCELHMQAWKKFENFYKHEKCKLISSNRRGMLLLDN